MTRRDLLPRFPVAEAQAADIDAICNYAGAALPDDYVHILQTHDDAEGWVGDDYVVFWPASEVVENNQTLDAKNLLGNILLFGGDGGGEAFGISLRDSSVVTVPLVGMSTELLRVVGPSISDWLAQMARTGGPRPIDRSASPGPGMNVYDITPTILGGDPEDPANKTWLTRAQLLQVARWWNDRIRPKLNPGDARESPEARE
jgi:hypothetical protein